MVTVKDSAQTLENKNKPQVFAVPILTTSGLLLADVIAVRVGIASVLGFILIL